MVTSGEDDTAVLWYLGDRQHPQQLATLDGHAGRVSAAAFSSNGAAVFTADSSATGGPAARCANGGRPTVRGRWRPAS
ncbi:hypothetical protein [Saccharopolyspora pogona]|uniref:hypothetical protein n=1 Tax=Saccharopolyspora pogona TaxID=333966 RepID=UPI0037CAB56E